MHIINCDRCGLEHDYHAGYCPGCSSCGQCGCCPCNKLDCYWCADTVAYKEIRKNLLAWITSERYVDFNVKVLQKMLANIRKVRNSKTIGGYKEE